MEEQTVLDPVVNRWLARIAELSPPPPATPSDERESAHRLSDQLFDEFGAVEVNGIRRSSHLIDTSNGRLRVDEYRPESADEEDLPSYLMLHGGAFRLGTLDEQVNVALASMRSRDAHYAVYSVDYRLAPEHPFPAGLDDAEAALLWLTKNAPALRIDPHRIVTGGVSAGGGIAAALALRARDRHLPLLGQLLEVPVADARDNGIWLGQYAPLNGFTTVADLRGAFSTSSEAHNPEVSVVLADLRALPPTHVMVAEYDPLRAAAEDLVRLLRMAGNAVTATRHLGHLHGAQNLLRDYRGARLWHAEVVAVLRDFAHTAATPTAVGSASPAV